MTTKYKIETKTSDGWMEMPGEPGYNIWDSVEEAEEIIKTLDHDFEYRVVESQQADGCRLNNQVEENGRIKCFTVCPRNMLPALDAKNGIRREQLTVILATQNFNK